MSLVLPNLKYGAACWDPYREGQIYALVVTGQALDHIIKKDRFKMADSVSTSVRGYFVGMECI